jgi:plasmid stabilization system protein ParE
MAELIWSDKASADLELIYDYISADSPFYARIQIERIFKVVERLRPFPKSGRTLPEFPNHPYREVIVGAYRCIYRFESNIDRIYMVTVVHGSRLLFSDMFEETP